MAPGSSGGLTSPLGPGAGSPVSAAARHALLPAPCHGLTRGFRKVSSGGSLGEGGVAGALVWELGDRLHFSAWHEFTRHSWGPDLPRSVRAQVDNLGHFLACQGPFTPISLLEPFRRSFWGPRNQDSSANCLIHSNHLLRSCYVRDGLRGAPAAGAGHALWTWPHRPLFLLGCHLSTQPGCSAVQASLA